MWSRISPPGLMPMPCTQHCMAVVLDSGTYRVQSAPQLRPDSATKLPLPDLTLRPQSSPATGSPDKTDMDKWKLFQNKITPTGSREPSPQPAVSMETWEVDSNGTTPLVWSDKPTAQSRLAGFWKSVSVHPTNARVVSLKEATGQRSVSGSGHRPDCTGPSGDPSNPGSLCGCARRPDWVSTGSLMSQYSEHAPLLATRRSITLESLDPDGFNNLAYRQCMPARVIFPEMDGAVKCDIDEDHIPRKRNRLNSGMSTCSTSRSTGSVSWQRDRKQHSSSADNILHDSLIGDLPPPLVPLGDPSGPIQITKSSSLDSLVLGVHGVQMSSPPGAMTEAARLRSRSFSRNDLILEDIEDNLEERCDASPDRSIQPWNLMDISTTSETAPLLPDTGRASTGGVMFRNPMYDNQISCTGIDILQLNPVTECCVQNTAARQASNQSTVEEETSFIEGTVTTGPPKTQAREYQGSTGTTGIHAQNLAHSNTSLDSLPAYSSQYVTNKCAWASPTHVRNKDSHTSDPPPLYSSVDHSWKAPPAAKLSVDLPESHTHGTNGQKRKETDTKADGAIEMTQFHGGAPTHSASQVCLIHKTESLIILLSKFLHL